jgi:hypothetical protein
MKTVLYDIVYEEDRDDLPTRIEVDFEQFPWFHKIDVGFGNLNCKAYLAIKEVTGCNAISCKLG